MVEVRWSSHTRTDFARIAGFWLQQEPALVSRVFLVIRSRVAWLAGDHYLLGTPIGDEARNYRWYRERRYGYKIYYRVEGSPPETISVIAIRHGRERPLKASTLRKYAK